MSILASLFKIDWKSSSTWRTLPDPYPKTHFFIFLRKVYDTIVAGQKCGLAGGLCRFRCVCHRHRHQRKRFLSQLFQWDVKLSNFGTAVSHAHCERERGQLQYFEGANRLNTFTDMTAMTWTRYFQVQIDIVS